MDIAKFLGKSSASFDFKLLRGRDLLRRRTVAAPPPLPTRIDALDRLAGGGFARGTLIELTGGRSCGCFSVVLSALAQTTEAGECAGLVDLGDHLDPRAAAEAGVDLRRLLWARPRTLNEALMSAEMILGAGFGLTVLDLGKRPFVPPRGFDAAAVRLARAAQAHNGVGLVVTPVPLPTHAPRAVMRLERAAADWQGDPARPGQRSQCPPVGAGGAGAPRLLSGLRAQATFRAGKDVSAETAAPLWLEVA